MDRKLRVYGASKLSYWKLWDVLRMRWIDWAELTSSWSLSPGVRVDDPYPDKSRPDRSSEVTDAARAAEIWARDHADVASADAVLVYAEPQDVLRGAIFEAGIGAGLGIPLVLAGDCASYSTWRYSPLAVRVPDVDAAEAVLREIRDGGLAGAVRDTRGLIEEAVERRAQYVSAQLAGIRRTLGLA